MLAFHALDEFLLGLQLFCPAPGPHDLDPGASPAPGVRVRCRSDPQGGPLGLSFPHRGTPARAHRPRSSRRARENRGRITPSPMVRILRVLRSNNGDPMLAPLLALLLSAAPIQAGTACSALMDF